MANNVAQDTNLIDTLLINAETAEPAEDTTDANETIPLFSNFRWVEGQRGAHRQGLPVTVLREELFELTGGLPKRVGDVLFADGPDYTPVWLDSPTKLFAWMDNQCQVDWWGGTDAVSQERFYANLQMTAEDYAAVEMYPHWPPLPHMYYMYPPLPANTNGTYLQTLVNFFSPAEHVDADLIRSFIVSLFWGGQPGTRPGWLITGPDHDPQNGRGVGKSTFLAVLGELVGGFLDLNQMEDIYDFKRRILSPEARFCRMTRLDNVKSHRFSWADLEGLITAPTISGHRMYHGEGRRPNTIVWTFTLNGASMSKDMAQRCVVLKLSRPQHNPTWEQTVRDYINQNRWQIIADIGNVLSS